MEHANIPALPLRTAILLAAALIVGCFETDKPSRVAGGDDFPNGVEPLGKKSAAAYGDSADWNGFDTLPRSGPGLYDTVEVPDKAPDTSGASPAPKRGAALARRGSAADTGLTGGLPGMGGPVPPLDTTVTRILDTAKGTVEAVRTVVTDSGTKTVDSTVFIPADPAKPAAPAGVAQVTRRLTSPDSARVDLWRFLDADGDGLLSPRAGSRNLAKVELTATSEGGTVETRTRIIAAGPDLDFNRRGDNRLLASACVRVVSGDTVYLARLLDADGDSVLLDFAQDTGLVDLVEERRFGEGSAVVSVTRTVRLVVSSSDPARNYPVRYAERRAFRDGAVVDIAATGAGPDSSFLPGAEARWTVTRHGAAGDSLQRSRREFSVRLAAAPGAFAGNVLLGVKLEEAWRAGAALRAFVFDFRPGEPVADGRWLGDGDLVSWVILSDGGRVTFAGMATEAGLAGQVTGPDGASAPVAFDLVGNVRPGR